MTNLIHQYVTIGLTVINGIILVPLYLRYIDYKLYGAWLSTGSIVAWMGMADAGLSEIIRQRTALVFGARDFQNAGGVIGTSVLYNCALGLVPAIIALLGAPFLPVLFGVGDPDASHLSWSFVTAGASVTMIIVSGAASSVLQGLQKNVAVCVIYVITAVLGLAATVILLIKGIGLISIPMGLLIRNTTAVFLYWGYVLMVLSRSLRIRLFFSPEIFREIASLTRWTFLYKMSYEVINQCDALVVGLVLGVETTPVFVLTKRLWDMLRLFLERIGVAFMPSLAHLYGEGDLSRFTEISLRLLRTTGYVMILGAALCLSLNRSFVSLWVGREIYAGLLFDGILAAAVLSAMFVWTINQVLYSAGCIRGPAVVGIFQNILRLILMLAFIRFWGLAGVAVSMPIACVGVAFPYFIRKWSKVLHRADHELLDSLRDFCIKAILFLFLAWAVNRWLNLSGWIVFTISCIGLGLVLGLLMTGLDRQLRQDVGSVLRILRRKKEQDVHGSI